MESKMEWTIRPTLRAFPVSIIFIVFMSYMTYGTNNGDAQIHIIMYAIMPAILLLFIAIRGRKYTLKNDVIRAERFLQPIQTMNINNIVNVTVKPVGVRAGHITLHSVHGTELTMSNIALSHNKMAAFLRL